MSDYATDMETIHDYVSAVTDASQRIVTAWTAALSNVQATFQTASAAEATPQILGVTLKAGLKTLEKIGVAAVKEATGADLGPIVDLVHGLVDEVDRAAQATAGRAVAEWITALRTAIINDYTQGPMGDALRARIEREYNANDEGGRGFYIGGIENDLATLRQTADDGRLVPKVEAVELAIYQSWINENFDNDCVNGKGFIQLQFDGDDAASSATVNAPLGSRVGDALNRVMAPAGIARLMDLDVVKHVCRSDRCMCFEGNNEIRMDTDDADGRQFLLSQENWNRFSRFSG